MKENMNRRQSRNMNFGDMEMKNASKKKECYLHGYSVQRNIITDSNDNSNVYSTSIIVNSNKNCGPSALNGMTILHGPRIQRYDRASVFSYTYISYLAYMKKVNWNKEEEKGRERKITGRSMTTRGRWQQYQLQIKHNGDGTEVLHLALETLDCV
jgi:hypothetical protein